MGDRGRLGVGRHQASRRAIGFGRRRRRGERLASTNAGAVTLPSGTVPGSFGGGVVHWISGILALWLWIGVPYALHAQQAPAEPVGQIAVTAKGAVSLDGTPITVDVLKDRLIDLKKRNGMVWYYRESSTGEPPAQATLVIKLITETRLPISMSTKPDFSDVLLPDGSTRPRFPQSRP